MKLSALLTDTRAINDGTFVRVDELAFGDLEICTRGYTDDYVDAQAARLVQAAQEFNGDQRRIPNARLREINAGLLRDFLVLDVRNLDKDDGTPVTKDEFVAMLADPAAQRLSRACFAAAARVSARSVEQSKAAAGNP